MNERGAPERSQRVLRLTAITAAALALLAVALAVYVPRQLDTAFAPQLHKPGATAVGVPDLRFHDAAGTTRTLVDWRGKVVLLNVWATWCSPCRKEMPALDRLQQKLGGTEFEVVALSIDRGGAADVRRFYEEIGVRALAIYVDPESEATAKLRTLGVPTTLLIDRAGRELWRKTGAAEWDSDDIVEELRLRLQEPFTTSPGNAGKKIP